MTWSLSLPHMRRMGSRLYLKCKCAAPSGGTSATPSGQPLAAPPLQLRVPRRLMSFVLLAPLPPSGHSATAAPRLRAALAGLPHGRVLPCLLLLIICRHRPNPYLRGPLRVHRRDPTRPSSRAPFGLPEPRRWACTGCRGVGLYLARCLYSAAIARACGCGHRPRGRRGPDAMVGQSQRGAETLGAQRQRERRGPRGG